MNNKKTWIILAAVAVIGIITYLTLSGDKKEEKEAEAAPAEEREVEPLQAPVQLVWQANGRCDPHRVWVYLDGTERESGLVIDVDMFGAVKLLTPDELEGR